MSAHKAAGKFVSISSLMLHPVSLLMLFSVSLLILSSNTVFSAETVGDLLDKIAQDSKRVKLQKGKSRLPKYKQMRGKSKSVNLNKVKPPSNSRLYYDEGTDEAELEKVIDEGIQQLYQLSQRFKESPRRGELWLRLADLYGDKARLIEFKIQNEFDEQASAYNKGSRKRRPRLDLSPSRQYNKKAVQLYEWFVRDFPRDEKVPQALFYLGYNHFELGNIKKGTQYYKQLSSRYSKSDYVAESNFALGEYYFENENWKSALKYYEKIRSNKRSRLYSFSTYKIAWCNYKMGQVKKGLSHLEEVILEGRKSKSSDDGSMRGLSRIRLATEAVKDIVVFYAEAKPAKEAKKYFSRVLGDNVGRKMLERLAYYYADLGDRPSARVTFGELISENPTEPKAYDYQYQIVQLYASGGSPKTFRDELFQWIETYGPGSVWSRANSRNDQLIEKANELIETALRNHILQIHKQAQDSRAPYSQQQAKKGYELYFRHFSDRPNVDEMHFFFGELLYDMGQNDSAQYDSASEQYLWVAGHAPKSKYYEKSVLNALLALEKKLPSAEEIKKIVGQRVEPIEFPQSIKDFDKMAQQYFKAFPKGEEKTAIKYRLGSLYYYFNQFDKALPLFADIIEEDSRSKYAEYSANLTLDIYNLKKDYQGLNQAAQKILSVPGLQKTDVAAQVKDIKERTSFAQALELEKQKDFSAAGMAFAQFAEDNQRSDLTTPARFNAAVNFERSGQLSQAIDMYALVLASRGKKHESLRQKSRRFSAYLYQRTGQYELAANHFEKYYQEYSKNPDALDMLFYAAVIQDGLNDYDSALKNYEIYTKKASNQNSHEALFSMAQIWQRRKNFTKAINFLERYMNSGTTNKRQVVQAAFLLSEMYAEKGKSKQAGEWRKKTVDVQKKLSSRKNPVGASFAAQAKLMDVKLVFDRLRRIEIPADPRKQPKVVDEKLNLINQIKEGIKEIIAYDGGDQIVAGLALQGQAYQHMASAIYNSPAPKGLSGKDLKIYRDGIEEYSRKFQDQAIDSYKAALARSQELQAYNDWGLIAYRELANMKVKGYWAFEMDVEESQNMDHSL